MMMKSLFIILGCSIIFSFGCSSPLQLASHWSPVSLSSPDTVRGENGKSFYLKDEALAVRLTNDSTNFHMSLTFGDRRTGRQVIMRGLTVWFDRDGGKEKRFGIHYPVGGMGMMHGLGERRDRMRQGEMPPDSAMRMPELSEMQMNEFEVYGPAQGDHARLRLGEVKEIQVGLRRVNESLVFDLTVPLRDIGRQPYAISAEPGAVIGVGLETGMPRMEGEKSDEPPMGGMGEPGSGGGFGGGGMGRRGGGGAPGGMRGGMKPLDLWMKVSLADHTEKISTP